MRAPQEAARLFPLVARPRPAYQPLDARLQEIRALAEAARSAATNGLSLAATAHNKAALIASDCGLTELTRQLCWQQFEVFSRARPLHGTAARYALEPLVNLARLHLRDGHGDAAWQLLCGLHQAVTSRADAVVDTRTISLRDLTSDEDAHRCLCQWLWAVLLADGTRALTRESRWDEALAHVERHHGIGRRLLDGRQVAVVANVIAGNHTTALSILEESVLAEDWEQAVAACLTVFCRRSAGRPLGSTVEAMIERVLGLGQERELLVARVRLGLAAIDLADAEARVGPVLRCLASQAADVDDGYAARELLSHPGGKSRLTTAEEAALTAIVAASGLREPAEPATLAPALLETVAVAEEVERQHLRDSAVRANPSSGIASTLWITPAQV